MEAGSHEFWGEGDERFFFDRATLPSVNGTGTEDYFSHGFGFREESSDPCHGYSRNGNQEWGPGTPHTMDRSQLEHPIRVDLFPSGDDRAWQCERDGNGSIQRCCLPVPDRTHEKFDPVCFSPPAHADQSVEYTGPEYTGPEHTGPENAGTGCTVPCRVSFNCLSLIPPLSPTTPMSAHPRGAP